MTDSVHVYTAVIVGTPDIPLDLHDDAGDITLDAGHLPHVRGTLRLKSADEDTLAALDPRVTPRIQVTVDATFPYGDQHRVFNLGLRSREAQHSDGSITLQLASDEALLDDWAPLVDDLGAFAYQSSLRNICDYVLGKIGAELEAGDIDQPMWVLTDAVNMANDPTYAGTSGAWVVSGATLAADTTYPGAQDGVAHNGAKLSSPGSTSSYVALGGDLGDMRLGMQAGKTYMISAEGSVRTALTGTEGSRARRIVAFYRIGAGSYVEVASDPVANYTHTGLDGERVNVEFVIPEGATEAFIRLYHGHTAGVITWALPRVTEMDTRMGADTVGYFWGGKPATDDYGYAWEGTANDSNSERTALIDRAPELLTWRAGVSGIDFIRQIVRVAGLRIVCDEEQKWTLRDESYAAPGSLNIRHGVNLIDGTDTISRDTLEWYDAAVAEYQWPDATGATQTRADSFALTDPHTLLKTFKFDFPYPGPGFAEYAVRRAQLAGREVTASSVADWTAAAEQSIVIVLDGAPTQVGMTQSITFSLSDDRMSIRTRTTDTPDGAIDLLTGTIDDLTGTIDSL